MKTEKAVIIVLVALMIIMAVIIGFAAYDTKSIEIHPVGPMTGGDENIDPYGKTAGTKHIYETAQLPNQPLPVGTVPP